MKTRVISAVVLIAIILPILIIGGLPFKIFTALISILGLKELIDVRKKEKEIPSIIKYLSYILIGIFILLNNYKKLTIDIRIIPILLLVLLIPIIFINDDEKYNIKDSMFLIGIIIFLGIGFASFNIIRTFSLTHLIYLVLITTITDTFALFTGMFIGKHKLCEKISPKKTIEGSIGGSLMGTIIPTLFYIYVISSDINIILLILITLLLTIIGQLGDLLFSSIKRHYKVKDFSKLIPGHGGILDRFDSLLLVVITYLLFMTIL